MEENKSKGVFKITPGLIILVNKVCSCGKLHKTIPSDAVRNKEGYWWNCSCHSTLTMVNHEISTTHSVG